MPCVEVNVYKWRPDGSYQKARHRPADLLTKAVASKAKFDKFAKWIMGYVDESVLAFMLQCRRRVVTGSDL